MSAPIVIGMLDSDAGRRALAWGAARAISHKHPLHLLTIVGGATGAVGEGPVIEALTEAAETYLAREAADLTEIGLTVTTEVRRGDPVRELTAASKNASVVVLGSDYRPGTGRHRGMHGVRVAAGSSCPVVVIPEAPEAERAGVIVGVDGSPTSEAAVRFAAEEAARLNEKLIAIGVWTPLEFTTSPVIITSEYLDSMQELTQESVSLAVAGLRQDHPGLDVEIRVESGYPSEVLLEAGRGATLTVVGTHGRGAIARFLLGSISHEVLTGLTSPTAVVR
ncbi:universal stress protein [Microbacterium gorillae]|uniref:universal stress protein n=1 Tax=Microbacterium gorillae TaxID=1231063 RepID=UPI00058EB617|nr:universal stress protein [Microbacterium gorillae]